MHDMMDWGMGAGMLGWILILVLIVLLVLAVFRQGGGLGTPDRSQRRERDDLETPLDILRKRYARGEISKEEFEQMKKDISS
jgi:putative membrane protein